MKNSTSVAKLKESFAEVRSDFAELRAARQEARKDSDQKRRRLTRIGGAVAAIAGAYYASRQGVDSKTFESTVEHFVAPTAQAARFAWGAGRFETRFRARHLAPLSAELAFKPGDRELKRRRRAGAILIAAAGVLLQPVEASPAAAEVKPVVHQTGDYQVHPRVGEQLASHSERTRRTAEKGDSVEGWAAQLVDKENGPAKITDWQVHKVADSIIDANPAISEDPKHWMQEGDRYDVKDAEQIARDVVESPKPS